MDLIKTQSDTVFDLTAIKPGDAIYAKNFTWTEGRTGYVSAVTEQEIVVQYHPLIGNVTNHFFIKAEQVEAGHWTIRWSSDLSQVNSHDGELVED